MFVEFEEGGGVFEIALLALAALGLDGAELSERFLELAGEALRVEAEGGEGAVGVDDVEGHGWMSRDQWAGCGGAGEELGFEERDAVEAPGGVGELVDELGLGGGGGVVLGEELLEVVLVGGEILGGEDGGAAGEAVLEGVEGRAVFAGVGAGAGGVLGVGAVDGGAGGCGECGG